VRRRKNMKIIIEEFYEKENDKIFRYWRYEGGSWKKEETPFNELPYLVVKQNN
jgi:hypothetical protein